MKTIPLFRSFSLLSALLVLLLATVTDAGSASHLVRQGETLTGIARTRGCTVAALRTANFLQGDSIQAGQRLALPAKTTLKPVKKPVSMNAKTEAKPAGNQIAMPKAVPTKPTNPGAKPISAPVVVNTAPAPATPEAAALKAMFEGLDGGDLWRVQIFLDRQGFAPGKVDGLAGGFTEKAAIRWLQARQSTDPDTLLEEARKTVVEIEVHVSIPKIAAEFTGELPAGHGAQAKAKFLPYQSLAEFMAERFLTDESALARLNPDRDLEELRIGQTLIVPAVSPFRIEVRESSLSPVGDAARGTSLRILHEENMLEVVRADGTLAAAFPITVGRKKEHIRKGTWKIDFRTIDPDFLYDPRMLAEGKSGPVKYLLPPGPNNPVGILWMELEPVDGPEAHIGIHGTDSSARIGRNQSSGCIRLANWDIVRLAPFTRAGTKVFWGPAGSGSRPEATSGLAAVEVALSRSN